MHTYIYIYIYIYIYSQSLVSRYFHAHLPLSQALASRDHWSHDQDAKEPIGGRNTIKHHTDGMWWDGGGSRPDKVRRSSVLACLLKLEGATDDNNQSGTAPYSGVVQQLMDARSQVVGSALPVIGVACLAWGWTPVCLYTNCARSQEASTRPGE